MDLGTLAQIASVSVERIPDTAARALGLEPGPGQVTRPVKDACPADLRALADQWRTVANMFNDHTEELGSGAFRAFEGWRGRSADEAARYLRDLTAAMNEQHDAMMEVSERLGDLGRDLEDAARDLDEMNIQTGVAIGAAVILFTTAIIAAAVTPAGEIAVPTLVCIVTELLVALIGAFLAYSYLKCNAIDSAEGAVRDAFDQLKDIQGPDRVKQVKTPTAPDLTNVTVGRDYERFVSEHMGRVIGGHTS